MNLNYSIDSIATITDGYLVGSNSNIIVSIFIDSRNHFNANNSLFIAIKGEYNDGHDYVVDLYKKGVRNFVIERKSRKKVIKKAAIFKKNKSIDFSDANLIIVENSIQALQSIATHHRKQFDIPVIGITGSNGKTIIKEWLYHLLRDDFNIIRSPKSYNSQVGVPLSVLQMNDKHTLAIFEAGISLPNEMENLEKIIAPNFGILSNIGNAHIENFNSKQELKTEKLKLFKNCEYTFIEEHNIQFSTNIDSDNNSSEIDVEYKSSKFNYSIPFSDKASIQNSLTCLAFTIDFGLDYKFIINKTSTLPQIALRLETRKGKNGNVLVIDNYNSDIGSLQIALDYLERYDRTKKRQLILSDIKQDKSKSSDLYKEVATIIRSRDIDNLIGIGKEILKYREYFGDGIFYESTRQFIEDIDLNKVENTIILTKGYKDFHFEKIANLLEEKTHETVLEINLSAISNNIKTYKNFLRKETMLLVMVKAYGYGVGSKEIGQLMQHHNINYLGVAYTDEGTALRNEGIDIPILVMNAEKGSFENTIENNLEPAIYSFKQLDDFIRKLIDLGKKGYPIHIKLDTGMSRLGFTESQIENLISIINSQPEVRVKSIFSHLAASDDKNHDEFTLGQIDSFSKWSQYIEESLGYATIKHILNSSGIERFSNYQMDMVRLGIGLYGVSPSDIKLETVGKLTTVISQIKNVPKNTSIGYGRSEFTKEEMKIGILPIGYADGFSRSLSNGKGHVLINGILAPVFGKVCMDMTIINLTNIEANEGDIVEIFGPNRPIYDLANEMNTIPYEVMTSVSERVVRVYLNE